MSRRNSLERTTPRQRVEGVCDGRQYSSCCLQSPGCLFIIRGWAWLVELEVDILWGRGDPQPPVGRINTTAAATLYYKAALGLPIPANPMAENVTINRGRA